MTRTSLEASVLETLRGFWRIKAAVALYKDYSAHSDTGIRTIAYDSVPQHGVAVGFIATETVEQATAQVSKYIDERLATDLFMSLVAQFESFLHSELVAAGLSPNGTLGKLQNKMQQVHSIPPGIVEEFDEVRERRNALIHSQGKVSARYLTAAGRVFARSGGQVPDPTGLTMIDIPSSYLSYTADVMTRYARFIP